MNTHQMIEYSVHRILVNVCCNKASPCGHAPAQGPALALKPQFLCSLPFSRSLVRRARCCTQCACFSLLVRWCGGAVVRACVHACGCGESGARGCVLLISVRCPLCRVGHPGLFAVGLRSPACAKTSPGSSLAWTSQICLSSPRSRYTSVACVHACYSYCLIFWVCSFQVAGCLVYYMLVCLPVCLSACLPACRLLLCGACCCLPGRLLAVSLLPSCLAASLGCRLLFAG